MSHLKESLILSFTQDSIRASGTNAYELIFPVVTPFTLVSGLSSSSGWFKAGSNPSSQISWSIREEITAAGEIGTINLTAAGAVTFTFSSTVSLNLGDVLTIVPPVNLLTASGSLGVSLVGER